MLYLLVLMLQVVDYMTMSAPTTRVDLVDVKPNQGSGRKEPNMLIIGCDYHPSMQQIAFVDTETGERGERRLMQSPLGQCRRYKQFFEHIPRALGEAHDFALANSHLCCRTKANRGCAEGTLGEMESRQKTKMIWRLRNIKAT